MGHDFPAMSQRTKGEKLRIREQKLFYVTNGILHYEDLLSGDVRHGRRSIFPPEEESIVPGLASPADRPIMSKRELPVHERQNLKDYFLGYSSIPSPRIGRSLFEEELTDFFKYDEKMKARLFRKICRGDFSRVSTF